jgi:hypothetical protein
MKMNSTMIWLARNLNAVLLLIIMAIITLFALIHFNQISLYKHDYASLTFPKRDFYVDPRKPLIIENYDKFYCDKDTVKSNEILVCNVYMKQKMDSNIDNLIEFHINSLQRDINNPEVDGYFGCVRGNAEYTMFRCSSAPFNLEKGQYMLDLKIVDTIYRDVKRITLE